MSQIFDALRTAEQSRTAVRDRRRSRRTSLRVPVFVYGHLSGRNPFHEQAYLQHVSDDGGLLTLSTGVQHGQKLLLTNDATQTEQKCFVVHLRPLDSRSVEVGIEFARPCPEFAQTPSRQN